MHNRQPRLPAPGNQLILEELTKEVLRQLEEMCFVLVDERSQPVPSRHAALHA
jgi:hypothetical protein